MKKILIIAVTIMSAVAGAKGQATISGITMDRFGEYWLTIHLGGESYATVSQWGELLDVDSGERIEYYNSIFEQEDGRVKSVGNVRFEYYRSIFDYEDGKIRSIGNLRFGYWNNFDDDLTGRLKEAGSHKMEYYDRFCLDDEKKGKPKKLCGIPVDFYDNRSMRNGPAGLLKSFGPKTYSYGTRQGNRPQQMNGQKSFETNGIRIHILDRLHSGR